jgi:hypothetical protein
MANKNSHSIWEILDTMVDYYKSNDYIYDNEDEIIVVELKRDAERMLAESNIYQLYHELAQYFHIPTPVGNMNPEYAIANLWQIAYDMRNNEGRIYYYRIYVPFDGKPGIREYVWHCDATHEWFKDPIDNSLPMMESFHKRH